MSKRVDKHTEAVKAKAAKAFAPVVEHIDQVVAELEGELTAAKKRRSDAEAQLRAVERDETKVAEADAARVLIKAADAECLTLDAEIVESAHLRGIRNELLGMSSR